MTTTQDLQNMEGRTAVDADGAKLGKVGQVYLDDRTGQPLWVTISTGLFGTKESFAPLYGSRADGDDLQLAVTKDMVKRSRSMTPVRICLAPAGNHITYADGAAPAARSTGPGPSARRSAVSSRTS